MPYECCSHPLGLLIASSAAIFRKRATHTGGECCHATAFRFAIDASNCDEARAVIGEAIALARKEQLATTALAAARGNDDVPSGRPARGVARLVPMSQFGDAVAPRATRLVCVLSLLLFGGCAQNLPSAPPPAQPPAPPPAEESADASQPEPEPEFEEPMAVVLGDKPLPVAQGALERIDCLTGDDDEHARVAIEARGSQVTSLAYYSRWRFQTCSIALDPRDQKARWRRTVDGATRIQTPYGSFLIRSDRDAYIIEFRNVQRMKYCGMYGRISGEMTIKRRTAPPVCSAVGILNR